MTESMYYPRESKPVTPQEEDVPSDAPELPKPPSEIVQLAREGLRRVASNSDVKVDPYELTQTWFGGDKRMAPPGDRK